MDWLAILDKWGWPALIMFGVSLFFYTKVWPLIEKFILGLVEQLRAMTAAMESMTKTLSDINQRTEDNLKAIQRIVDRERK